MNSSYDFLVVGAGIAGLRAVCELGRHGTVLCLAKQALTESNTQYAQGGIAVAMAPDDSSALHLADTIAAGAGLVNEAAAKVLCSEGPERVRELIEWGVHFDRDEHGELAFTREGAHCRSRVLHADGDSTGREMARALYARAAAMPNVSFAAHGFCRELLLSEGRVVGVELLHDDGRVQKITARAVLLATGGLGVVFANTTNPDTATGDGPALAARAGATLEDMEFVQFHPTALYLKGAPRFLISEAVRGEGAYLLNARGERFMLGEHPMAELAPRDVVARAIHRQVMESGEADAAVYLDLRHLDATQLRARFPRIAETCRKFGIEFGRDLIPIRPAAHYAMGGVRTDLDGRTTLPGLYAAGEAACTGVHGANRLASNSLLEGLVYGARAAQAMAKEASPAASKEAVKAEEAASPKTSEAEIQTVVCGGVTGTRAASGEDVTALRHKARELMETHVGMVRTAEGLAEAITRLKVIHRQLLWHEDRLRPDALEIETRNIMECGLAIARSALERRESRGSHWRSDYPATDDAHFRRHSLLDADKARLE